MLSNRSPTRPPFFFNSHFLPPSPSLFLFTPSFITFFFSNNTPPFFIFRSECHLCRKPTPEKTENTTLLHSLLMTTSSGTPLSSGTLSDAFTSLWVPNSCELLFFILPFIYLFTYSFSHFFINKTVLLI